MPSGEVRPVVRKLSSPRSAVGAETCLHVVKLQERHLPERHTGKSSVTHTWHLGKALCFTRGGWGECFLTGGAPAAAAAQPSCSGREMGLGVRTLQQHGF